MGQDCFSHSALLCIEHVYVKSVDIEKAINEISLKKSSFQGIFPTDFYTFKSGS